MFELPGLAVWPDLDIERPCRTGLACQVPCFVGDCSGCDKEVVRLVLESLPGPGHVDDGIDDDIGNVHTPWPEISRHCLRQDALRRFCRGEPREICPAAL